MPKELYKVEIAANNEVYKSTGETMLEALINIPLDVTELKTKGTVTFKKGNGKPIEKFMYFMPLKFLLGGKIRKIGYANQFERMLREVQ